MCIMLFLLKSFHEILKSVKSLNLVNGFVTEVTSEVMGMKWHKDKTSN